MEEKENSKNKVSIPIIIVIAVIVLFIVGVVVFSTVRGRKSENSTATEAQETTSNGQPTTTEAMQLENDSSSLIDMKNTENAEIVEGEKVNTSKDITRDRELDGLKLTEIKLKTEAGISKFTAKVKNETGKDFEGGIISIKFKYGEDEEEKELQASIPEIKKDGTSAIDAGTTADIVNAKDFELELLD